MKKRILCIDDSYSALLLLEFALNDAGYEAVLAQNIRQAIQSIKEQLPEMILLDLSMPVISGFDFLKMRNELHLEKIPIIIISAHDSDESILSTREHGAIDFVSKPINIDNILKKIREYLKE